MTDEQIYTIERLVLEYVDAHVAAIPQKAGERRKLWANRHVIAEYRAVTDAARTAAPAPRHADAFVEGYNDDLLQESLDDPDEIPKRVRALRAQLEHEVSTRLYVPLDGIIIDEDELHIGAVRLVRMDDATFEKLVVDPFAHIMDINPNYDAAGAADWVAGHRERRGPG